MKTTIRSFITLLLAGANVFLPVTFAADTPPIDAQKASVQAGVALQSPPLDASRMKGKDDWLENTPRGQADIEMILGNARTMKFNRNITRVATSAPEISDVVVVGPDEIMITSKKLGSANIIVWDNSGAVFTYNITIIEDPTVLNAAIKSIAPETPLEVYSTKKGFVVKGNVGTVEVQKQIENTAKAFSKESVSVVTVNEAMQIVLEIRFVEINRKKAMQFGIDGLMIAQHFGFTFTPGNTPVTLTPSDDKNNIIFDVPDGMKTLFTGSYHDKNGSAATVVKALEEKNIGKVIAKPNLLVRDGEEADFLVGGEIPIPAITANTTQFEYKKFGTQMTYTPTILNDSMIRLKIDTEVSQLDYANSVVNANFRIPAITTRTTKTTVELKNFETLLISGLLQRVKTDVESGTPYLRRIPLLGRLFESTDNSYTEVELLVFVTPHIVNTYTEGFDASKLDISNPIRTTLEGQDPPFEDSRALAMEQALTQIEHETAERQFMDERALKRQMLWNSYMEKKKMKRAKRLQELEKKESQLSKKNSAPPENADAAGTKDSLNQTSGK